MGHWWSDHSEAAISTAVGTIVSIFLTYWGVRLQRAIKRLSYVVVEKQRLVPVRGYKEYSELKITLGTTAVKEPWIVIVQIENNGNQDIGPADITRPITIDVGNSNSIRDASVTGSTPEDLYEAQALETDDLGRPFLDPVAINRGNSIRVQVLLDGKPEKVTVVGRGVGIDNLTELQARRQEEKVFGTPGGRQFQILTAVLTALLLFSATSGWLAFSQARRAQDALTEALLQTPDTVAYPTNGSQVPRNLAMTGTFRNLTSGATLWAFVFPAGSGRYYPTGPCETNGHSFSCTLVLGSVSPADMGRTYIIYLIRASESAASTFNVKDSTRGPASISSPHWYGSRTS